ncbi:NAD(P)H-quinone oxidoreductase [Vulgatibacter incomptus]|uniref:Quinone oxidoreductase n=1 Tax=Vulgatibacter incomptus TaxID=1391653 RepID=A0A0K1PIB2_9BACT|nr:NAD(P)H-quinone oxidoreductase [Vulgatibacter incomptus]AKU93260.1 Quinone oxidoreductase [Vulgatibacter incomptus]
MHDARAVTFRGAGGPEVLEISALSVRDPGPNEVLVEVAAAGLNRADLLQRRGVYPAPTGWPAKVLGLEYAGTVLKAGELARGIRPGDRVMGIVGGGAMSTHLVVHAREVIPIPEKLSFTEAAAIPEVFLTAFDALFVQGNLHSFETVLLHAVGSGVGTAAVQLCRAAGCRTIGTSRSKDKLERALELGLSEAVLVNEHFSHEVLDRTNDRGVELILDTVGGAYLTENLRSLATQGRIVVVGLLGGADAKVPLGMLLSKRATLIGTLLRSRLLEEKATLAQRFIREALPLFSDGRLRPVVDEVLPMERIADAHRLLESNATFGKVVLTWGA